MKEIDRFDMDFHDNKTTEQRDLVGLIAYRFLLILCSFKCFFFVEPEYNISFSEEINEIIFIQLWRQISLVNTEETKSLIIPIYYM